MNFVDWDKRPAVAFERSALAVLEPGGPWVDVDFPDVWSTAAVMSESAWRARFEPAFGSLSPPTSAHAPGLAAE